MSLEDIEASQPAVDRATTEAEIQQHAVEDGEHPVARPEPGKPAGLP